MKNAIVVLIAVLLSFPVFAQQESIKINSLPDVNSFAYPKLISCLRAEKKHSGLLHSKHNELWTSKRFSELFSTNPAGNVIKSGRRTFMDGPAVYPVTFQSEISKNANTLNQRYHAGFTSPSAATTALQILGLIGGIAAGAFDTKHNTGNGYKSAADDYLQSTYHQHEK